MISGDPEAQAWLERQWEKEEERLQARRQMEAFLRVSPSFREAAERIREAATRMGQAFMDASRPLAETMERIRRGANPPPPPFLNRALRRAMKRPHR